MWKEDREERDQETGMRPTRRRATRNTAHTQKHTSGETRGETREDTHKETHKETREETPAQHAASTTFAYSVLLNELFHLQDLVSLATFDPSADYSGKLNFAKVVHENGLELDAAQRPHRDTHRDTQRSDTVKELVKQKYAVLRENIAQTEEAHREHVLRARPTRPARRAPPKVETLQDTPRLGAYTEEDDSDSDSSSGLSEYELLSPPKKKIRLVVSQPQPTITNPLHVTIPKFSSFAAYLDSFKILDDDLSNEQFQQHIAAQRKTFLDIKRAVQANVLQVAENMELKEVTLKDVTVSPNSLEPIKVVYKQQNQFPLQEHLVNHGVVLARLFRNSTKNKIARTKKIANMIEQHFKHIQGAKERKIKEEHKRVRALAKTTAQQVKKRWVLAEKAFKVLKKNEEDELKKIQGKKHLSEMLEKSTMLLGQQLNVGDESDELMTSEEDGETSSSSSGGSDSDDELSTDEEEENVDEDAKLENDLSLTIEQLKEKYKDLDEKYKEITNEDEAEEEKESEVELTEKEKQILQEEAENEKNSLLDEESETEQDSSMDSDSGSVSTDYSSSENESDQESQQEEETHRNKPSALGALFGKIEDEDEEDTSDYREELKGTREQQEQETDDAIMDETPVQSDTTTPKPTGEGGEEEDVFDEKVEEEEEVEDEEDVFDEEVAKASPESATDVSKEASKEPTDPLAVVDVPVPSLLKGTLRTYQKQGLNWLASLYNNKTNGILADEMGLGKTIQTISLLSWLACEKHIWGPHLIVVPTSVLLNWEMEFKRFAPGFKVLSYYGTPQERKQKRKGWNKEDAFHICITSYQLVVTDQHSFKRKKWQYMILDEAHNIKNFRSTRWQALLNFNTERRLLLTGTPLQNNITELWSLLYFLMPKTMVENGSIEGFADLDAFQQWFGNPVDKIIEANDNEHDSDTKKTVEKLHQVLRPYLLRRLKADVEKQMPGKYEHIIYCKLSKRQRYLYDEFMSRAQTKETLAHGNFLSIINCLMQLRKVCNHPDLFEVRPIITSLAIEKNVANEMLYTASRLLSRLSHNSHFEGKVDLAFMNLLFTNENSKPNNMTKYTYEYDQISKLSLFNNFQKEVERLRQENEESETFVPYDFQDIGKYYEAKERNRIKDLISSLNHLNYINKKKCNKKPRYGKNLIDLLTLNPETTKQTDFNESTITSLNLPKHKSCFDILFQQKDNIEKFGFVTPNVVVLDNNDIFLNKGVNPDIDLQFQRQVYAMENPFHQVQTKLAIEFPDKSLLQYDCGKLQKLANLLIELKDKGHRALIFTQMTKVLDILEQFLNNHGYLYLRLDGATKIEDRQMLTEKFNNDTRITCFILSSRSGGLGINLTGADTVIFYDSDWNPAMDKQCQDRCHRIGQTRDVHIYRFVSEHTIESNILKKAQQKTQLDNVIIQQGDFTTDYFSKMTVKDLLGSEGSDSTVAGDKTSGSAVEDDDDVEEEEDVPLLNRTLATSNTNLTRLLAQAEDEDDARAVNVAMQESYLDNEDFKETSNTPGIQNQVDGESQMKSFAKEHTNNSGLELKQEPQYDEFEGTNHVEEYMIRYIANGYYYD